MDKHDSTQSPAVTAPARPRLRLVPAPKTVQPGPLAWDGQITFMTEQGLRSGVLTTAEIYFVLDYWGTDDRGQDELRRLAGMYATRWPREFAPCGTAPAEAKKARPQLRMIISPPPTRGALERKSRRNRNQDLGSGQ